MTHTTLPVAMELSAPWLSVTRPTTEFVAGSMWTSSPGVSGELVHIDPATNSVVGRVTLNQGALSSMATGNVVWVMDEQNRSEERRVGEGCRSRWWPDH